MLANAPIKSNVERQREFRLRHPGYFQKYRRRVTPQMIAETIARAAAAASQPTPVPPAYWHASA